MKVEDIPTCDFNDPASLEAWFGRNHLHADIRKVVLALCREIERARLESEGVRYTVDKVDDRARLNKIYTNYLLMCLEGTRIRDQAWREAAAG